MARSTVKGEVKRVTRLAVLFKSENGVEAWVPRSVCLDGDEVEEGDTDLVIADWFIAREGLE